ncbi:MAG TPA: SDR family NAD(P)-dependent oxidoreductase [Ramlibacter sp.]|uniref:SDR family NAD(P)-dependent oxidoreductase n=1 Tax=Ramlibacter sp. TaxID=1917967 RepID=UPI002BAE3FA7|nr:SDR family NAD(P)-dependent oxidoreductase [Ramlibacter sp.]HVZ45245.1 SDR family NAD(P)-dependent oxidoreductase [Ramlibacter sp.]
MDLGLKDQVVVITGAGRGIGREAALTFAAEGARVVAWDKDVELAHEVVAGITKAGGTAMALGGSVGVRQEVEAGVARALEAFGRIDVLINNAAFGDDAPLVDMTDEQWDRVLNVCLTAPFYCARAVAPTMIAQKYGRIINIASRAHLGEVNKANYCAAKAGVLGLSRALAVELGVHDITVNTIAPGIVRTERVLAQPGYEGLNERAQQRQLIKRAAQPSDIVNGMLFFASRTSGFITGDLMYVTGGRLT